MVQAAQTIANCRQLLLQAGLDIYRCLQLFETYAEPNNEGIPSFFSVKLDVRHSHSHTHTRMHTHTHTIKK